MLGLSPTFLFIVYVAMLAIGIPYLSPIPTSTDIQPVSFILALFCVTTVAIGKLNRGQDLKVPPVVFGFGFLCIYAVLISLIQDSFNPRVLFGYVSVIVFAVFGVIASQQRLDVTRLLLFLALAWFLGAQLNLWEVDLFSTWIHSQRTTHDRGLVSFAPEPSFYGISLVFILIWSLVARLKGLISFPVHVCVCFLLLLQLVLFAQSSQALIGIVILTGSYLFLRLNPVVSIPALLAAFVIGKTVFHDLAKESTKRSVRLLDQLLNSPLDLVAQDASVNHRVTDVVLSVYGFIEQFPFPIGRGTDAWELFHKFAIRDFEIFATVNKVVSIRIMSGFGAVLFETGIVGFIVIFWMLLAYLMNRKELLLKSVGCFLFVYMFSAVTISFPLFGFLLGYSLDNRQDS